MSFITIKKIAACAICTSASGLFHAANAHITLEYQVANAASSYKATFRVGHGCGDSATREIAVTVPASVEGAKPMPKPGWTVTIERAKLAEPRTDHGKTITDEVRRIRWTAQTEADALPNDFYDEFVLQARMPAQAGASDWPVEPIGTQGRIDWSQVPADGQSPHGPKLLAVALRRVPAVRGHAH